MKLANTFKNCGLVYRAEDYLATLFDEVQFVDFHEVPFNNVIWGFNNRIYVFDDEKLYEFIDGSFVAVLTQMNANNIRIVGNNVFKLFSRKNNTKNVKYLNLEGQEYCSFEGKISSAYLGSDYIMNSVLYNKTHFTIHTLRGGAQLWEYTIPEDVKKIWGQPILVDDVLVVDLMTPNRSNENYIDPTRAYQIGLDIRTGEQIWRTEYGDSNSGGLLSNDKVFYRLGSLERVEGNTDFVTTLDPKTGRYERNAIVSDGKNRYQAGMGSMYGHYLFHTNLRKDGMRLGVLDTRQRKIVHEEIIPTTTINTNGAPQVTSKYIAIRDGKEELFVYEWDPEKGF